MSKYLAIYGKPRYLGIIDYDGEIKNGSNIVVESHRGEELAISAGILTAEQEAQYRQMRSAAEHGDGAPKNTEPLVTDLKYISLATDADLKEREKHLDEEKSILKQSRELLKQQELDIKLIDVEFLRGKHKLFIYFSSEQRVDFRAYVRDLAREFKTRIELRQIGVRDEAKIIRGIGPCGHPCCCSYWLDQFAPIGIKMVKEQNLALNPAKISGICGRLMCCMCFEHNVYSEIWSGLPNPGSKIKTPNGNIVLSGVDVANNNVRCYVPEHGEVKVPIDKFAEFKEVMMAGGEWAAETPENDEHVSHAQQDFDSDFNIDNRGTRFSHHENLDVKNDNKAESGQINTADNDHERRRKHRPRLPHKKNTATAVDAEHGLTTEAKTSQQNNAVVPSNGQPRSKCSRHHRGHGRKPQHVQNNEQ